MLNYKWIGAVLGAGALLLRFIAAQLPEWTEEIYSRTFFPVIRQLIDMSISKLPFPSVYLFVAAVGGIILMVVFQIRKKEAIKSKDIVRFVLNFLCALIFHFLLLWGYNYQRITVYKQLSLEPSFLGSDELLEEIELTHGALLTLRLELASDTLAIEETIPYLQLEDIVREE